MLRTARWAQVCPEMYRKVVLIFLTAAFIKIITISTAGNSAPRRNRISVLTRTRLPPELHLDQQIRQDRTPPVYYTDTEVTQHRDQVLSGLHHAASNWSRVHATNRYYLPFIKSNGTRTEVTQGQLSCQFSRIGIRILNGEDEPFSTNGLGMHFPQEPLLENKVFKTCSVVMSSGAMLGSNHGSDIDEHEAVLRLNDAVTFGYEDDVGSKTTLRLVNTKLVSKPVWTAFIDSELTKGVPAVVWDPSKYQHTLTQWFENPDYSLFAPYFHRRILSPDEKFYIMDPIPVWKLWEALQNNSDVDIITNPPSSGFIGIMLMLQRCWLVDIYGFFPTLRGTEACHYYEKQTYRGCALGGWHPLAAEKLLIYRMTNSSDRDIFEKGVVRLKGFNQVQCDVTKT